MAVQSVADFKGSIPKVKYPDCPAVMVADVPPVVVIMSSLFSFMLNILSKIYHAESEPSVRQRRGEEERRKYNHGVHGVRKI
jgi:hypothetical protein